MGTSEQLKGIIERQREVLTQLEAEYQATLNSDLAKENTGLKAELEKLRAGFDKAQKGAAALVDENARLKNALYEQIYNEKINIINATSKKLDIYFRSSVPGELNKLTALESGARARIRNIAAALEHYNIDARDDIYKKLDELSALLDSRLTQARTAAARADRGA